MSNDQLRSRVSELERELSRAQAINDHLTSELSTIASGVYQAKSELDEYKNHIENMLDKSGDKMFSSHNKVISAYELQGETEQLYRNFKNIESAYKKIRMANNTKYYNFENYRNVRKIVQSIMDNLDLNMISNKAINKAVEIQHLQNPDYWLTCVLTSVMSWKDNLKQLANTAIERALALDKKNSAIFYMLFNLRMGREEAALKWFGVFQSCDLVGADQRTFLMLFSLLNKTISQNLDSHTYDEITNYVHSVINDNLSSTGYNEDEILDYICASLEKMKPQEQLPYPYLVQYCQEYKLMENQMMLAKNNISILEFILKTVNVPVEQRNAFLKEYIEELVARPTPSEKTVYEEIAYNELIIKFEGNVEKAREVFKSEMERHETELNLLNEIIHWIFERDQSEISAQTRKIIFTLTKDFHEKSITNYVQKYRNLRKTNYQIKIGDYASDCDLSASDGETASISNYFTKNKNDHLSKVKNTGAYIAFGGAAVACVGAYYMSYFLFILAVIGVTAGSLLLFGNKNKRNKIELDSNEKKNFTIEVLQKIMGEYQLFQNQLTEYDAYFDQISAEFAKI